MAAVHSKATDTMRKDVEIDMVERCGDSSSDDLAEITKSTTMGTVTISDSADTILVPTPSADPRGKHNSQSHTCYIRDVLTINVDPLNMPLWRKKLLVVLVSICMALQLLQWISLTHVQSRPLACRWYPVLEDCWASTSQATSRVRSLRHANYRFATEADLLLQRERPSPTSPT
jgi:hypothetical protein